MVCAWVVAGFFGSLVFFRDVLLKSRDPHRAGAMAIHMHMHLLQEVQRPSKLPVAVVALVGASIRLAADIDLAQGTLELRGCGLIQQALVVLGDDGQTAAVDRPGASHDKSLRSEGWGLAKWGFFMLAAKRKTMCPLRNDKERRSQWQRNQSYNGTWPNMFVEGRLQQT